jgi:hypothetical protein
MFSIIKGIIFGANKGRSKDERSPSAENLRKDGECSPFIFVTTSKSICMVENALHKKNVSPNTNTLSHKEIGNPMFVTN